ncbi:hypothetical protein [Sphingorhabdus sp. EL138]|uniref:hypothetical protein n=1 Tax=Sphingorhabdus sp. EL138 TaxID=2073156 RepID=UPI000D69EA11|nr:hypothetical protein [Sphingorhabdus sp. EL138]
MAKINSTNAPKWYAYAILALVLTSGSASANAETTDITIGEFLKPVIGSTDTKVLPATNVARQYIDANGINKSQYRIIVDDNYAPYDTFFEIRDAYKGYCEARDGKLDLTASKNNYYIKDYYSNEFHRYDWPNISGYQLFTAVCQHRTSKMWSAMAVVIADRVTLERKFDWSNVAPLNLKTFSTTTTVMAVDPAIFDPKMQEKVRNLMPIPHKSAPSPLLDEFRNDQSPYLLRQREFQANLAVGDQTNCGKVLEIRGPLVKIKLPKSVLFHKKSSAWINKDRLTNGRPVDCTKG